jgi:hypothetical protein
MPSSLRQAASGQQLGGDVWGLVVAGEGPVGHKVAACNADTEDQRDEPQFTGASGITSSPV